ncbi:hypothetical protein XANCAGTX0491_005243 [Xanthoria calcicola]
MEDLLDPSFTFLASYSSMSTLRKHYIFSEVPNRHVDRQKGKAVPVTGTGRDIGLCLRSSRSPDNLHRTPTDRHRHRRARDQQIPKPILYPSPPGSPPTFSDPNASETVIPEIKHPWGAKHRHRHPRRQTPD